MYNGHKVIALCIAKACNGQSFELIEALNKACVNRDFTLFIYHSCSDFYHKFRCEAGDKAVFELMDFDIVDAVIVFEEVFLDQTIIDEIAYRALENETPLFFVGTEHKDAISFVFDFESGFEQVVRHIIEYHGVRNTCFIAGKKDEPHSEQRIEAYKKVLEDNNIPFSFERLFYGDYWSMPTIDCVEKILSSGNLPEAIICVNDSTAITVCEQLNNHGIKVPDDIIVTGFDGIPEAKSNIPTITTSKCRLNVAAENIIERLSEIFEGSSIQNLNNIPYVLDIHHSCGCKETGKPTNTGDLLKKANDRIIHLQDDERFFYEMTESVIECNTPEDFCTHIKNFNLHNTSIILNNECMDKTVNPTISNRKETFDETMFLLYQAHTEPNNYPKPIKRKSIVPNLDYIVNEFKFPLVFSCLSYYGIPMGYVCFSFGTTIGDYSKIPQYVTALNRAIGSYRLTSYLRYTTESLECASKQDFMTGLYNRKGFFSVMPDIISTAKNNDKLILIASVDIDGLKYINDTFGHEEGDFAIKSVCDAVKNAPYNDKVCGRFGGDELVVCTICNSEEDEEIFKDSVLQQLKNLNERISKPYPISASIGVCISSPINYNFDTALKSSDEKMYIMKMGHPNRRKQ